MIQGLAITCTGRTAPTPGVGAVLLTFTSTPSNTCETDYPSNIRLRFVPPSMLTLAFFTRSYCHVHFSTSKAIARNYILFKFNYPIYHADPAICVSPNHTSFIAYNIWSKFDGTVLRLSDKKKGSAARCSHSAGGIHPLRSAESTRTIV